VELAAAEAPLRSQQQEEVVALLIPVAVAEEYATHLDRQVLLKVVMVVQVS
jgi:hypothetical protein